ncbi:PTS sugar transporter subunit IIB [Atopobiaceae bacterium HCP3S3_F7]
MAARIIVACGSGIATSQMVAKKIDRLLREKGVEADVAAVAKEALAEEAEGADAYVAVVKTEEDYDVPTFNGVAFLTGIGEDEELARLVEAVRDK